MTLKDALGFTIDYGKFIVAMWGSYIALVVTMIGWLMTLRSMGKPVDGKAQKTVIAAFVCVSAIFAVVLYANNQRLIELMSVVDALAKIDANALAHAKPGEFNPADGVPVIDVYGRVFNSGPMATILWWSTWFMLIVVPFVCWFMWDLARSEDPVTTKSHRK